MPHFYSITPSARASSVGGNSDAKCLGGLEVDDQFELGRLLDRQVGRLRPFEDFVHVAGSAVKLVSPVYSACDETP